MKLKDYLEVIKYDYAVLIIYFGLTQVEEIREHLIEKYGECSIIELIEHSSFSDNGEKIIYKREIYIGH